MDWIALCSTWLFSLGGSTLVLLLPTILERQSAYAYLLSIVGALTILAGTFLILFPQGFWPFLLVCGLLLLFSTIVVTFIVGYQRIDFVRRQRGPRYQPKPVTL